MDRLFNLMKPAPFKAVKDGDPAALLQDFEQYVKLMQKFFITTGAAGDHVDPHNATCGTCTNKPVDSQIQVDEGNASIRASVLRMVAQSQGTSRQVSVGWL